MTEAVGHRKELRFWGGSSSSNSKCFWKINAWSKGKNLPLPKCPSSINVAKEGKRRGSGSCPQAPQQVLILV